MTVEEKTPLTKRLEEIDILRGIAMLAVVSIHVSNIPLAILASGRRYYLVYMFNSFINFAVPMFILISAIMAAYSEANRPLQVITYYKKKLVHIGLPYIVWSLLYILFNIVMHKLRMPDLLSWRNWISWILQGRAYEHLYFLAVILQFHVLFPLLIKLTRLVKDKPFLAFLIAVGGQNIVYWLNKLWIYERFTYFYSSFFGYFGIIFLGLYLGLNYDKVCQWMRKNAKWLAVFCLISAAAFLYYRHLLYEKVNFHSYPYSFIRLFFVASLPLCLLAPAQNLRLKEGRIGRGLQWIGRYTLGIYLAHPVLNFFLRRFVRTDNPLYLLVICAAAVFAFTIICGYITKILEKFELTAWLVGATVEKAPVVTASEPQSPE